MKKQTENFISKMLEVTYLQSFSSVKSFRHKCKNVVDVRMLSKIMSFYINGKNGKKNIDYNTHSYQL